MLLRFKNASFRIRELTHYTCFDVSVRILSASLSTRGLLWIKSYLALFNIPFLRSLIERITLLLISKGRLGMSFIYYQACRWKSSSLIVRESIATYCLQTIYLSLFTLSSLQSRQTIKILVWITWRNIRTYWIARSWLIILCIYCTI